jgi:hypothetical protein
MQAYSILNNCMHRSQQQLQQHGSRSMVVCVKLGQRQIQPQPCMCCHCRCCCCRLCKSIIPRSMVESHGAVAAWPAHIIVKHAFSIDKLKVRRLQQQPWQQRFKQC